MMGTFDVSETFPDDLVPVIAELDRVFGAAGVNYVVVGALARDVMTSMVQGTQPERLTKDVDVAIRVGSIQEFKDVTKQLPRLGRHEHRFLIDGIEIDVLPYTDAPGKLPFHFENTVLDISGLAEAESSSIPVQIDESLVVNVAPLTALATLKILAWRDRRSDTTKDAIDLNSIFKAVDSSPYWEAVWDDDRAGALVDHDVLMAGAAWLGLEAARLARDESREAVIQVLEEFQEELALDMGDSLAGERLVAFWRGIVA